MKLTEAQLRQDIFDRADTYHPWLLMNICDMPIECFVNKTKQDIWKLIDESCGYDYFFEQICIGECWEMRDDGCFEQVMYR